MNAALDTVSGISANVLLIVLPTTPAFVSFRFLAADFNGDVLTSRSGRWMMVHPGNALSALSLSMMPDAFENTGNRTRPRPAFPWSMFLMLERAISCTSS
ncbi:MAG: hypothetical protein GEU87_01435 [Alphaproteobacteria bacterium]|nr:hypothetical protein [Alphaproteobacteria bacterium]